MFLIIINYGLNLIKIKDRITQPRKGTFGILKKKKSIRDIEGAFWLIIKCCFTVNNNLIKIGKQHLPAKGIVIQFLLLLYLAK